jgi:hypothetical protein
LQHPSVVEDNETLANNDYLTFPKSNIGKEFLMCYIFRLTLLSTFSKVKVKNNLSDGCFNLSHPSWRVRESYSQPSILMRLGFHLLMEV